MKPVLLTMESFGSYGEKTVIDFRRPNQDLFLITGDTGSGKSTIFDAIVFALYGEGSSTENRKTGQEFKSQFGPTDREPKVEMTFTDGIGEERKTYVIRRSPNWERPVKRMSSKGEKTTRQNRKVELFCMENPQENYSQAEADAMIAQIVGLSREQFMQVAMIAQGEFMKVLSASSTEKKAIFSKLFNTGQYQKIAEALKEKYQRADQQKKSTEDRILLSMESCRFPESLCPKAKGEALLDLMRGPKAGFQIAAAEAFCEDLAAQNEILEAARRQLEEHTRLHRESLSRGEIRLSMAKRLEKDRQDLERAEKILEECESRGKEAERSRILIERIPAAHRLYEAENRHSKAKEQLEKIQKLQAYAKTRLPVLMDESAKAKDALEKAAGSERETSKKCLLRIEQVKTYFDAKKECEGFERRMAEEEETFRRCSKKLEALEKRQDDLEKRSKDLQAVLEAETAFRVREQMLSSVHNALNRMETRLANLKTVREKAERLLAREEKTKQEYLKARSHAADLQAAYQEDLVRFLDSQAGLLARDLEEGKPCPVCGSTHHPHPAVLQEDDNPVGEKQLEVKKEQAQKAQEQMSALSEECKNLHMERASLERSLQEAAATLAEELASNNDLIFRNPGAEERNRDLQEILKRVKEDDGQKPDEDQMAKGSGWSGVLERRFEELQAEYLVQKRNLEKEGESLRQASAALEKISLESKKLEEDIKLLRDGREEAAIRKEAEKAGLQEKRRSLIFDSDEKARMIREKAERLMHQAAQAEEEGRKAQVECERKLAACRQSLESNARQLPELEKSEQEAAALRSRLGAAFLDFGECEALVREFPDESAGVKKCSGFVNALAQKKAAALSAKKAALESIGDQKREDPAVLEENVKILRAKTEKMEERFKQAQFVLETNRQAQKKIESLMKRREQEASLCSRLKNLSDIFSGKQSGGKMDLETFAQRVYLREILKAANRRFVEMNGGQFELQMRDFDSSGTGKNRGLDLMVYSTITGKSRPVHTLSGGESFMAALSLALGMADQIRQNAAGISLDMMFVDEGFGSLDDHSRSQAIRVLQDLTQKQRMIGIISHVSELKQEIEDQLIVKKTDQGSEVCWQIS